MTDGNDRARELHELFDRSFAAAPPAPEPPHVVVLRIRLGGEPYAIALSEIAALHADLATVRVPSPAPELLGVAAVRGALVAVHDLRLVLGIATPAASAPRWSVIADGVGLAFDGLDGHAWVAEHAIATSADARLRGVAMLPAGPCPIVGVGAIVASLRQRWRRTGAEGLG